MVSVYILSERGRAGKRHRQRLKTDVLARFSQNEVRLREERRSEREQESRADRGAGGEGARTAVLREEKRRGSEGLKVSFFSFVLPVQKSELSSVRVVVLKS